MPTLSAGLLARLVATSGFTPLLTLQDKHIDESSGLAVSRVHRDLLWTHNDGGSHADIFGIDRQGVAVARIRLRGIDPYDPEALAPGRDPRGRPALFLGDTGDNSEKRPDVSVFRVTEPRSLGEHTVTPTWFKFRYPDGPHDAEALLVDPRDGRIWIATKSFGVGGLYVAPRRLVTKEQGTNALRRVADLPPLVTDGTFLPGGRFVLRTYTAGYLYDRPGHFDQQIVLPVQEQGESLAFDGDRLLAGSEGRHSEIYPVPLPGGATGSPAPSSSSGRVASAVSKATGGRSVGWSLAAGGLVLAALALVTERARRRRAHR